MTSHRRTLNSEYMFWAKQHSQEQFCLSSSGITNYPIEEFPATLADIALTGTSYYGYAPLQNAIANNTGVSPDCVFQTIGTSLANHIAIAVLIEPGDEILLEHPTYELIISTAQYLGPTVKRFCRLFENQFAIDIREIERNVSSKTKLIVLTNLHNPGGAFTDQETIRNIGEIAQSVGARVLVDEVYLDAAFDRAPASAVHLGPEFIVTNSLTKVYGLSGLRCGWVLAEPHLIKKMWQLNDLFCVIPAHPAERLSVIAFEHLDMIKSRSQRILAENHARVTEFLNQRDELAAFVPPYGTVVFPRLKSGNVDELYTLLHTKYSTSITPGRFFEMPRHFRIGIGCMPEILMGGLRNIAAALDELKR